MPNHLQRGAALLGTRLKVSGGVSVTYHRGAVSVAVTAIPEWDEQQVQDSDGLLTTVVYRRYVFVAADLVLAGNTIKPRAGDRVMETIASEACEFEIVQRKPNPAGMQKDESGLLVEVFSQRVKAS